jgi:hypothetical protein
VTIIVRNLSDFLVKGPVSGTLKTQPAKARTTVSVLNSRVPGGAVFAEELSVASYITNAGANVAPPEQGEVYRVALTASSVVYTLPTTWNTKYVTMRAVGEDLQYQFGRAGDTLSLTLDQVSGGTPPAMTVNNASGATLKDGESESFRIYGQTQFAVIGASATGYFEIWLAENTDSRT